MRNAVVLDSTCFIELPHLPPIEGGLFTTGLVLGELRSPQALSRFERVREGIAVRNPSKESLASARRAAESVGDRRLSPADLSVLALAIELRAAVATDDYSLENACKAAGVEFLPMARPGISGLRKHPRHK